MKDFYLALLDELSGYASQTTTSVPSHELTRLLTAGYNSYYQSAAMQPVEFLKIDNLSDLGRCVFSRLPETSTARQFIVELGNRRQGSLHYFALWVDFTSPSQITFFGIDHYKADSLNLSHLHDYFVRQGYETTTYIAGDKKLQNDNFSCIFFSLHSLGVINSLGDSFNDILSEYDTESSFTVIPWVNLPMEFYFVGQSMSFMWHTIDLLSDGFQSELNSAHFCNETFRENIFNLIAQGIQVRSDSKVINAAISSIVASRYCGYSAIILDECSAQQLVNMLYKEDYPRINSLLNFLITINDKNDPLSHPLFSWCYRDTEQLELFLEESHFRQILHSERLLTLGINAPYIFNQIIISCIDRIENNKNGLKKISINLDVAFRLQDEGYCDAYDLLALVFSPRNLDKTFEIPIIKELLENRIIDVTLFSSIIPHFINEENLRRLDSLEAIKNHLISDDRIVPKLIEPEDPGIMEDQIFSPPPSILTSPCRERTFSLNSPVSLWKKPPSIDKESVSPLSSLFLLESESEDEDGPKSPYAGAGRRA